MLVELVVVETVAVVARLEKVHQDEDDFHFALAVVDGQLDVLLNLQPVLDAVVRIDEQAVKIVVLDYVGHYAESAEQRNVGPFAWPAGPLAEMMLVLVPLDFHALPYAADYSHFVDAAVRGESDGQHVVKAAEFRLLDEHS